MDEPDIMLPTPVGGSPRRIDGAPSVLFAALYVCLFPFIVWRLASRGSRTVLIVGAASFAIEHVVIWSLRASQAYGGDAHRTASGLVKYLQLSFGGAYLVLANDAVQLLRVLLVRATGPPDAVGDAPYPTTATTTAAAARTRYWTRRGTAVVRLLLLVPLVTNIVAGTKFDTVQTSQAAADGLMSLRYASAASALLLLGPVLAWTIAARCKMHRALRAQGQVTAANHLILLLCLLLTIVIYRLGVMHLRVPSLLSTGPGWAAQESGGAKALFFVFHALPEWAAAALFVVPNTRALFRSGVIGDWRVNDGDRSCAEARKARRRPGRETIEMS